MSEPRANQLLAEVLKNEANVLADRTHIINPEIIAKTQYVPICKETVAYIVSILLFNEHGHVCLIQEAKRECRGKWYLPAGRTEPNESLMEAARREAREETGYVIEPLSLVCVEIDHIGLWYRFTFTAKIVGGSLKTPQQADSESIQAQWFNIETVKEKYFKRRSSDMIRSVEIANEYYNYYGVHSFSQFDPRDLLIGKQVNLFTPALHLSKHIVFSFLVLNHQSTHCLLNKKSEGETTSNVELSLPSIPIVPDVYLKQDQYIFEYAVKNVLLPFCFEPADRDTFKPEYTRVLAVDYNGRFGAIEDDVFNDGIHMLFLIRLVARDELTKGNLIATKSTSQMSWTKFEPDEPVYRKFKNDLSNPFQFITLKLND
jgi:8-oxo-dGTP pyrophosphatase MutT (NUDIX family)